MSRPPIRIRGSIPGLRPDRIIAGKRSPPTNLKAIGQVRRGEMNKTEAAYAEHLELERLQGRLAWWAFEPLKLRLADSTFYTPDFALLLLDGRLVLDDVKGRSGDSYYCQEDSKLKVKVAAQHFPAVFRFVWPLKGGGWGSETF